MRYNWIPGQFRGYLDIDQFLACTDGGVASKSFLSFDFGKLPYLIAISPLYGLILPIRE